VALRIVFMGTGGFAVPAFRAIVESRHTTVGLFTQPERTGAGHHRHVNPLKRMIEGEIPVFQPEKVNLPESIDDLRSLLPDLCVVAAYGQILSAELLSVPRLGAVNLHASLLPKYRGAAPIQAAILHGETETGVTIFQIEPKLDAGPILAMEKTQIGPKETAGELQVRLAALGASMIVPLLDRLEAGTAVPLVQDSTQACRAPRLKKESGRIDWSKTPAEIDRQVRAFHPWPMAYTTLPVVGKAASLPLNESHMDTRQAGSLPPERSNSPRLILLEVAPPSPLPATFFVPANAAPGTILFADRKRLVVQTGQGPLEILRLQAEGKRAMSTAEFLGGRPLTVGQRFG
jgi:methionyl-tRNA formyltransferase